MPIVFPAIFPPSISQWKRLVMPKEHGSWSLALEPLAFGLVVAPSLPGVALALAVLGAFFARRPLRISVLDARVERRAEARGVLLVIAVAGAAALLGAVAWAGWGWLGWLLPSAAAGLVFLFFDLRNVGRETAAEIAGAAAFAFLLAALAILGGKSSSTALALAVVMCGRALPTVLYVRAALRVAKTEDDHRRPALIAAVAATVVSLALARAGLAPWTAVVATLVLAIRAFAVLGHPLPLRAGTIGMMEAGWGLAFVIVVGAAWRA